MSSRILPKFELFMPESIEQVVDCLGKHGNNAAVMAGGTDLMVRMKSGFSPEYVVSLSNVPGLDHVIYDEDKGLTIGAMATLNQVLESRDVKDNYPALHKSAYENGTEQTRNVATVVGNILNASPAGDCACAILALGGYVVLHGPDGSRQVNIDDFWINYRETEKKTDEFAVEVVIHPSKNSKSSFSALTRTKKDLAKINAAAAITMEKNICSKARLAMGAVGPTHIRLKKCEALLEGHEINDDILERIVELAPTEINPIDDVRSSAEYRRSVSGVLMKKVIKEILS